MCVCVCEVGVTPPPCMNRAVIYPCLLLMLDAAARCYRGLCARIYLKERGHGCVILSHTNTFTTPLTQLPLTLKLPSMQPACHSRLHPSDLTSERELLGVFQGHILISFLSVPFRPVMVFLSANPSPCTIFCFPIN